MNVNIPSAVCNLEQTWLEVSRIEIVSEKISRPYRIAFVADLDSWRSLKDDLNIVLREAGRTYSAVT